jgi:hypothetical protein
MNLSSIRRRPSLAGGACLLLLAGAAFACSKSEAATSRPQAEPTKAATGVAAGAKAESENYIAEIKVTGPYAAGKEGTVEVVLVPKGSYHINAQYPYKFKATDPAPAGVTFPKPLLQRADGTFEEKKGSFKVPFVAAKAGKATVSGTLSLSVCSDANCIMDKVELAVDVDVK